MNDLKSLIGRLNVMGSHRSLMQTARRMALGTVKAAKSSGAFRDQITGIAKMAEFVESEAASWVEPDAIETGQGGAFDACDLRHWLALAERAGVPAIQARQVLTLSEAELEAISQKISNPEPVARRIEKGMRDAFPEVSDADITEALAKGNTVDPAAVFERLFTAMEDVPSDWMVRSNISGSSMLKALAGSGVIGDGREGSKLAPEIEVGAGWVQAGNRRRIDATDNRFIDTFARGHKSEIHYLARPWVESSRRILGEDPHRHGSPFAGKGEWPAEWRVFVSGGQVTGVGSYYGWIGEVTPENAYRALEAADLAQKVVDEALKIGAHTRFMDLEILRTGPARERGKTDPMARAMLEAHPSDSVSCTLDFMETVDGMMLLEGGPAHLPIGGAHPVAFAGHGVTKETGAFCDCTGVALALAPGVCLGDPKTWVGVDTSKVVLGFDEARELAARFEMEEGCEPGGM